MTNNSLLKELDWNSKDRVYSATHWYAIVKDDDSNNLKAVIYKRKASEGCMKKATGFKSTEEAKDWCWNHYNEKMKPYLK